ncbi:hypothetical protein GCM10023063_46220 [Arthrobacter methylotrophus]
MRNRLAQFGLAQSVGLGKTQVPKKLFGAAARHKTRNGIEAPVSIGQLGPFPDECTSNPPTSHGLDSTYCAST